MKRLLATLVAGTLIALGCSSESSQTGEKVTETTVAPISIPPRDTTQPLADHTIDYVPKEDSFSFENFGGGEAPADLTVNTTRRLYGDSQVCSDVTDNQCTPYPVILQLIGQANRSMQGGLCEGLTVLSLRLANDPSILSSFQGTETVAELVKEDPALISELVYWYVTQFATEVQEEASSYLKKHPAQLAEVLLRDFEAAERGEPSTGYTIGIYSEQGGHAVTPYRVEETPTGYRIYIYDSNWPTTERYIDVDGDGWSYALAATNPTEEATAWGGGVGTMELTPMQSRSGPFSCSFCPSDTGEESGTMLTVASSGSKQMALKIETESGDRLGYYDGSFVNEIEGATYRYLISGPSTADPVLVFLPPGIETFSADVEEIDVPTPEKSDSAVNTSTTLLEQEQDEPTQEKFSLLLLNEEKSVQVEAAIQEEPEPTPVGTGDPMSPLQTEPEIPTASLISFSEDSIGIAEVEDATVAIAIDALEVEIPLQSGQVIEVVVAPNPEPAPDTEVGAEVPPPTMLDIAIEDTSGEVLAEVEVDLTDYLVEEEPAEQEDTPPSQGGTPPPPEEEIAPVTIQVIFDEEAGEVILEEEEVEAWVASDAEYFQAIAEDRLEEVLGESYAEEILEREEWIEEELFEDEFDLLEIILNVDEEYWEDEIWEEVSYDDEWFEEEAEIHTTVYAIVEDIDEWFEEEAWEPDEQWVEIWEEDEWFEEFILEEEWIEEEFEEEEIEEIEEIIEELIEEIWFEEEITDEEWEDSQQETPSILQEIDEEWFEEELAPTTTWMEDWDFDEFGEIPLEMLEWSDDEFDLFEEFLDNTAEEELEVWEEDPFLNTEEEWEDWEDEFWFEDSEIEDDWIPEEEEVEEEEETPPLEEEEWESNTEEEVDEFDEIIIEEEWDNPYADCIGTAACADAPSGFDSWAQWESANNPNYVAPEVGDPDYVPPPPPPPVYVPTYWAYSDNLVTSRVSDTSASTVTTVLARGEDGHWYETHTTETTVTTTTYTTNGTEQYSCVDNACAISGTTWDDETSSQSVAVTTATEVVPASCSQGGWTGLGDWCIVDSHSRNDHDWVAFSVPTAAEENEACDCTDGDGLMDIRIDAESNLTRAQFGSNNEHADPYIYLNHDTDSDDGDHSGDRDAITVGNQIAYNDDSGRDCGNACSNPPSTATDPDETPNVTLANGDPVIENVSDSWDSRIERELSAGDYVVRGSVYNNANSGWYRLTIRDADVTYP